MALYCLFHIFFPLQCKQYIVSSSKRKGFALTSLTQLAEHSKYYNQLQAPSDLVQPLYLEYMKTLRTRINTTFLCCFEMSNQDDIFVSYSHQERMVLYTSCSSNYTITLASDCQENSKCGLEQILWHKPECTHSTYSTKYHYITNTLLETNTGMVIPDLMYLKSTLHQYTIYFWAGQKTEYRLYSLASSTQTESNKKVNMHA